MADYNSPDWIPSKWLSPEESAIQQELAETTAKRTANLAEDVAELMIEGWPKVEQFFSGKLPGVSDDALKSLLAKSYEIQLRDGEAAAAEAFRDGLGVGKVSRAHIDALMRDINLVSDNSLSKSAAKALQLAANDPSKFTANLTDEIAVLAGESNTKRRATNFQKVMSIGETKNQSATLMDAIRGKMRQDFQLNPSAHPIVAKAKNILENSPEAFKPNDFVEALVRGKHLSKNPEVAELMQLAEAGPAGAKGPLSGYQNNYFKYAASRNPGELNPDSRLVKILKGQDVVKRPLVAPSTGPQPGKYARMADPAFAEAGFLQPSPPTPGPRQVEIPGGAEFRGGRPLRKIDGKTFAGLYKGQQIEVKQTRNKTWVVSLDGRVIDTQRSSKKAISQAKRKASKIASQGAKEIGGTFTEVPGSFKTGSRPTIKDVILRRDTAPAIIEEAASELAIRNAPGELAIQEAARQGGSGSYPLALRPKGLATEAASGGLLKALGRFAKRHPVAAMAGGVVGGDLLLEGLFAAHDELDYRSQAPLREAQRRATPSTREMIESIYLQRQVRDARAKELQANPHLAAYEKHQADLAAGQVPGMVTF